MVFELLYKRSQISRKERTEVVNSAGSRSQVLVT